MFFLSLANLIGEVYFVIILSCISLIPIHLRDFPYVYWPYNCGLLVVVLCMFTVVEFLFFDCFERAPQTVNLVSGMCSKLIFLLCYFLILSFFLPYGS